MEHVVFYQSTQGTPAFRRMASIEDAVSFAEHLRNVEGVTDFSVYALSPVSLKLRAYYHVEISDAARAAQAAQAAQSAPPAQADAAIAPPEAAPPPLPDGAPSGFDRYAIPPDAVPTDADATETEDPVSTPESSDRMFVTGPLATAPAAPPAAFVKGDATDATSEQAVAAPEPPPVIDPSVVDPTVEEVVPTVPTGRRSMGFFARS